MEAVCSVSVNKIEEAIFTLIFMNYKYRSAAPFNAVMEVSRTELVSRLPLPLSEHTCVTTDKEITGERITVK